MEAALYDCYICKSKGTYGVCAACLTTLPNIANIKTEHCDCDCIEEICSCLDPSWNSRKTTTSTNNDYQAEYLDDPSHEGQQIVKISATSAPEWKVTYEFAAWLSFILFGYLRDGF